MEKVTKNVLSQIDNLDQGILTILLSDGRTTYAEIGKELHISAGTVFVRVKKMQDLGIITGNHISVDQRKLGYDITAFLGVFLEKSSMYNEVAKELKAIPEVVSAHYTTGGYSIFVKIICRDTEHLRDTLSHKLQHIKGIQRTETFISLDETIERPLNLNLENL